MQAGPKFRRFEGGLTYWCQGCKCAHSILIEGEAPPEMLGDRWTWNGDLLRPVFSPSVHVYTDEPLNIDHPVALAADLADCERRRAAGELHPRVPVRRRTLCHAFVGCNGAQPGEVIFLADCAHHLAGTMQVFPDLPEHLTNAWYRLLERLAPLPPAAAPQDKPFTWRKK